jgi:hypothetical protein
MFLDVGNLYRIDNPTPGQIAHHLRNLPAEAPFLILNADDRQFIQAMPAGDGFRVEWRQEAEQRFMLAALDRAEASSPSTGGTSRRSGPSRGDASAYSTPPTSPSSSPSSPSWPSV